MSQNNNQPVRRSRRLATIIPASHWISIGYSQAQATAMEKLQNGIKEYCDSSGDVNVDLNGRNDNGDTLPHHDMMIPHWKKLATSLSGRTTVEKIELFNICLPPPVLDIAFPALQSNLNSLSLANVSLGSDGYRCLSTFLEENTSLKQLIVADDAIDMSVAIPFSDAVRDHPTLENLGLINCGINNRTILGKLLEGCTKLNYLGIIMNDLGSEGIALIANFIRSHKTIEYLNLSDENLSDGDASFLASAVKDNTILKRLDLRDNNITREGEKTLLNVMYDPTSMDSIVDSNHICIPFTYDIWDSRAISERLFLEQDLLNINRGSYTVGEKIRKKVVLALCGHGLRYTDVEYLDISHFNELPLGVMPRVLELIQEHSESRFKTYRYHDAPILGSDALSRLFHTLRGWELPLLFGNLRASSVNEFTGKRKRRKTRR